MEYGNILNNTGSRNNAFVTVFQMNFTEWRKCNAPLAY